MRARLDSAERSKAALEAKRVTLIEIDSLLWPALTSINILKEVRTGANLD